MKKYLILLIVLLCFSSAFALSSCGGETDTDTDTQTECTHFNEVLLESREPTCTGVGLTSGSKCDDCGEILIAQRIIVAKGHTNTKQTEENRVEPTCTKAGYYDEVTRCSVCDEISSIVPVTLPATGHTEKVLPRKEPNCVEAGLTEGTGCSVCEAEILKQEAISPRGHSPLPFVVENIVEPTCKAGGYDEVVYCNKCDDIVSVEHVAVPAILEHSPLPAVKENYVEPICKKGGYDEVVYCGLCNDALETTTFTLDAIHSEIAMSRVEPTCESDGLTEGTKCSLCEEILVEQETILALGHIESSPAIEDRIEPTCKDGSYNSVIYCSVCDKVLSKNSFTLEATDNHTPAGAIEENRIEPICKAGSYDSVVYCSVCDVQLSRTKIPLEAIHNEKIIMGTPATCTTDGTTDAIICSACHIVLKAQATIPGGHTIVKQEGISPTCTTEGKTDGKICSVCGEVFTQQQIISALGHNYSVATYEAPATCQRCGATTGQPLEQKPIYISKPSVPITKNDIMVTSCTYNTEWNGDGTYDVTVSFTITNLSSSTIQAASIWATLSGIEASDALTPTIASGESGTCIVYFKDISAGIYEIIVS